MTDLQPRLITPVGQYDKVEWQGRNVSGIQPFGDRVLILPDQPATKIGSVYISPNDIEHIALAAETGVLIACGDGAWFWNSDRTRKYEGTKPGPGQRVYFERYAGAQFHGRDGVVYRLMDDKAVGGLAVEPEGGPVTEAGLATHVVETRKLQEAIARWHGRFDALPEIEAPPLEQVGPVSHVAEALKLQEAITNPMGKLDLQTLAASGTYTPTPGATVTVTGGGAGGGAGPAQSIVSGLTPATEEQTAEFHRVVAALPLVEAPPLAPDHPPGWPNDFSPIEPKFPRYTVKDGQMLMAFNRQDMKDKAPNFIWFDTAEEAKSAGGN